MKKTIYCKESYNGLNAFYVSVGSNEYYLFSQKHNTIVYDYFKKGVNINQLSEANKRKNTYISKTVDKIPSHLTYIEKEYNVKIFDRERSHDRYQRYKRHDDYRWSGYYYEG